RVRLGHGHDDRRPGEGRPAGGEAELVGGGPLQPHGRRGDPPVVVLRLVLLRERLGGLLCGHRDDRALRATGGGRGGGDGTLENGHHLGCGDEAQCGGGATVVGRGRAVPVVVPPLVVDPPVPDETTPTEERQHHDGDQHQQGRLPSPPAPGRRRC